MTIITDTTLNNTASTTVSLTGDVTTGGTTITNASTTVGLEVGQYISGVQVPINTTITAISGSTITLSRATAEAATATPLKAWKKGVPGTVPPVPSRGMNLVLGSRGKWINPTPSPYLYNFDPRKHFRHYRKARGDVAGQWASSTILGFGDSQAFGNNPLGNEARFFRSPGYSAMNVVDTPFCPHWWDACDLGLADSGFDPRITVPGDAVASQGYPSVAIQANPGTGTFTFTPKKAVNMFEVIYRNQPGQTFTLQIGSETAVPFTQTGTASVWLKRTITSGTAAGTKTLKVSGAIEMVKIDAYDTASYAIRGIQYAVGGAMLNLHQQYLPATAATGPSVATLKSLHNPCLVMMQWGYDLASRRLGPDPAFVTTFKADYSTMINRWKDVGTTDILLITPTIWADSELYNPDVPLQEALIAMYELADQHDLPLVDQISKWGSWQEARDQVGFISHWARPGVSGNMDAGYTIAQALMAV